MNFIDDLEKKYSSEVQTLSLGAFVTALKAANEKVRTLTATRTDERMAKAVGALKASEFHFCVIFPAKKFVLSMIICIFASSVPTKPLNDAQMRGAFLFIYVHSQNTLMERLPHFMKHYMTEADLMTLLKSRGLVISDEGKVNILQLIQHVLQWFKL